jgi:hypothetical protein
MIYTKDKLLTDCQPRDISFEEFLKDCESAINTSELHSDERSSDDEALAQKERDDKDRPEQILNTNSVIKVYNKQWRSARVCNVANYF